MAITGLSQQAQQKRENQKNPYGTPSPVAIQPAAKPSTPMPQAPNLWRKDGNLQDRYELNPDNYQFGMDSFRDLERYASSTQDSPWLRMAKQNLDVQQAGLMDQAGRQANVAGAGAMSNLAMSGGLDSGARERIASGANLNRMNALQAISQSGAQQRTGLGMQEGAQKLDVLKALPGIGGQRNAFESTLQENNVNRDVNARMFNYGEQMKGYTGEKMARATANGGGKK